MGQVIQHKRGPEATKPNAISGEMVITTDSNKVFFSGDGTTQKEVATMDVVYSLFNARNIKQAARVATTADIALSGLQTIDGVSLVAGDRVLVKDQTDATKNGIYVANAAAWGRATDANTAALLQSAFVYVSEGTVNSDSGWMQKTDNITLDTSNIVWSLPPASLQNVDGGTW